MLQTIAVKEVTEVVRGVDDVTNDNTFLCEEDHLTVREVNVQEDTALRVRLGPIRGRGRDRPPTNGGRSRQQMGEEVVVEVIMAIPPVATA